MPKLIDLLLIILILVTVLAVMYLEFRPWLRPPDTVLVSLKPAANRPQLHPLDRLLLEQRFYLESNTTLKPALTRTGHQKAMKRLWVDACEVSQRAFRKFTQWLDFQPPKLKKKLRAYGEPSTWKYSSSTARHRISGRLDAPVSGVTFYDAHAYCTAAGGRLPTADEWHAIAAGQNNRLYPWGNEFSDRSWPYLDPLLNAAQPCGLHPEASTSEGIHDLGGNVSEWSTGHREQNGNEGNPLIHGGNGWDQPYPLYSLSIIFRSVLPTHRSPYIGFRCVYDTPPTTTAWREQPEVRQIPPSTYLTGVPQAAKIPRLLLHLPSADLPLLPVLMRDHDENTPAELKVMRHEVTRTEYARFIDDHLARAGLYADPGEPIGHNYTPENWQRQLRAPQKPVTGVDWWSAHAYAKWAGGRLPSADEWVKIAAGRSGSVRPWGDAYAPHAVTLETKRQEPAAVGTATDDRTEEGILDMAGNVSEWTATWHIGPRGYAMLVKGGNFTLPGKETTRVSFTNAIPPNHRSAALGFRVVFD